MVKSAVTLIRKILHGIEDGILVSLISSLLLISFTQIVMRNAGIAGFTWAEDASRVIVLWLAMFGAMRASRLRNHIAIDLMTHYGQPWLKRVLHMVVCLFSATVCGFAAWHCLEFVIGEYEFPTEAFLGIPVWACEAIMPFALAVIGMRFLHQVFLPPLDAEIDTEQTADTPAQ
ncbi:Uncharacterised protein [BD1-7 clade bacterium]|uniref:TRAP transporter small permease protein n=1 Tax=BD1-7 clade bacterium TaxID=2029982 RepID=A0A5S9PFX1_9GAMM|nr:Uncharacterised protein [BD1-7 clade bacterium]CAA0102802.1 Uncharacterised protein [BD1-7 clade bacterium]